MTTERKDDPVRTHEIRRNARIVAADALRLAGARREALGPAFASLVDRGDLSAAAEMLRGASGERGGIPDVRTVDFQHWLDEVIRGTRDVPGASLGSAASYALRLADAVEEEGRATDEMSGLSAAGRDAREFLRGIAA